MSCGAVLGLLSTAVQCHGVMLTNSLSNSLIMTRYTHIRSNTYRYRPCTYFSKNTCYQLGVRVLNTCIYNHIHAYTNIYKQILTDIFPRIFTFSLFVYGHIFVSVCSYMLVYVSIQTRKSARRIDTSIYVQILTDTVLL